MNSEPLILNVDDYDANRYVRSGLLRRAGYRVVEARGGREALARVTSERPDLVVLDVQMPDLDGLEVCRRLRADPDLSSILVLHVSATSTATDSVVAGLDNGADGYLTDNAEPAVLLATVRSLLRLRRAEQERNEARARLTESENRLSRLVGNLRDVVYRLRLHPDLGYEYISPAVTALTGYTPQELCGEPDLVWRIIHPDDIATFQAAAKTAQSAGAVVRWICRDGRVIWIEHRLTGIKDGAGRLVALEGVARDITVQKAVEEELRRANQAKDEFLATLSHELRTPLNAIVGWSQMLQAGKLPADMAERAIEAIARNAMAQRQLINDVLDVSRIITGKMRLNPSVFDLTAPLTASVEALRPAADAKGIELQLDLGPATLPLMGDADRLQQVFWNLMANAVKFTPAGGRVTVRAVVNAGLIEISVQDTGVGIPAWFLPHVFERFTQVDSSMNRRHHGLGLGLALVRHLVELHGGTVSADSEGEGLGTTIRVKLPLRLEAADPTGQLAGAHAGATELAGVSIMLVDDEADSRQIVGTVLRQAGADVSEADSTQTALAMLPLIHPDVIVSDIGMPGLDGLELIRLVRTLPSRDGGTTPAIALTAYGRDEDRDRALEAGYQMHLAKPVLPDELTHHVAALMTTVKAPRRRQ